MKPIQRILKVFVLLFVLAVKPALAQNVGISTTNGFTPDASAALDISYTNKGLLVPRVALTATNAAGPITSPATSLLVYNTATAGTSPNNVTPGYYYWGGSAWVMISTTAQTVSSAWLLTGNPGITPVTNFLGTTDNQSLRFRTNNTQRFLLDSLGNAAIGLSPTFSSNAEKLLVDAGTTSSFNVISGKGNINNYLQLNIQNNNAGTNASSDVVATADNGNETTNYVDMGINSSANTAAFFGAANDAYLYNSGGTIGGNFFIGNSTSGKVLGFLTGGGATTNERMRIDGTGNVGIGTTAPTQKLDIAGNLKFSGAFMPNNNAGTAGYFLQSAGAGAPPVWFNAGTLVTSQAWGLLGNAGTNYKTNFLGTTDNQSLRFRTNNTQRFLLDSLGNAAIGLSPTFSSNTEKFLVDAGTTTSFNVISGKGNLNNYLQLNIQNNNAGTNASSDVVATADNGNETTNYVDMGINSSANTAAFFGAANDAYLYNSGGTVGGNFFIGNSTSGKVLGFLTGGGATTNERMRIDGSGNVGIGTTAPSTKLHIVGTNPLTLNGVQTGTNTSTDSLLTLSSGLVRKLPISTFASTTNSWSTIGNAGTTAGTNFIGTTDAVDFVVKTSGAERVRVSSTGQVGIGTNAPTTDFTLFQSAGSGGTKGFRFAGNSIGGVSSGTGFLFTLGYNVTGNKQIWFGDPDGAGNTASTFLRIVAGTTNLPTLDAVAGDNANRRFISIGTGGDPNGGVMFGNDGTGSTSPSSFVWDNGNMAIGSGYKASAAPGNGLLVQGNVGIGTASPSTKLHVFGANPLTLSGVVTGTSTSADSLLTITNGLVRKLPISTFASPTGSWSTTGNAGTTAGTNFIGTTDANDMVFKANNVERMRIVNGTSSATGTTGDITVGDANSGTLRSNKEMVLRQDGDQFGPSAIRLRNRNGQNGAIFETTGGSANLVDFIFNTGTVSSPISSNIRFETRSSSMKVTGNTTEWQFGQPDTNNGGPTLIVGASGNGSNSAIRTGNFAIGATTFNSTNPEKLLVDASNTASFNVISGRGNLNNYLQLNIQNSNSGTNASSDVVATADNGNETVNYVDMGINSSGNTAAYFGGANDAYLYNAGGTTNGGNFFIGTSTSGKILGFMTGGGATTNERMRIDATGKVGIGTTTPNSTLSLAGSLTLPFVTPSGSYTILATDHVIINTGSTTGTWTLPAANTCPGRVYRLINQSTGTMTISPAIYTANATTSTTISNTAGANTMEVISDGTNWRVIGN